MKVYRWKIRDLSGTIEAYSILEAKELIRNKYNLSDCSGLKIEEVGD